MPETIPTKAEYFRLAAFGHMGNQMPSWPTPESAIVSGYHGAVMIRYMEPNSPFMRPDVAMSDVPAILDQLVSQGARRESLYLTHMSPSAARKLNGELWNGPAGLYLNHSTAQTHLRAALDLDGRHAERSAAFAILRWACDPASFDDLMILLDRYSDSVIEFTAYENNIGNIKNRNTIIWEVRNY